MIFTAVTAAGLGIWKAVSYRHPAHANVLYQDADFTSTHSITVGPNVVAIRSIARNRYDGSIDVRKGPDLSTSIPNADILKNCCQWLDVVQIELGPGRQFFEIEEIRVFHHDTRTIFKEGEGLAWQLISPDVIQIQGLGKEVPDKFDLWIRGRSYPGEEMAVLRPKIGAKADISAGTIELVDLTDNFVGWDERNGFVSGRRNASSFQYPAIRLAWEGDRPREEFREINIITKDGKTHFSNQTFNLRVPSQKFEPFTFSERWHAIDHFEIRPKTKSRAFFFDGLKVPPRSPAARRFDPVPSVTRTTEQLLTGSQLVEYAPLDIFAQFFRGSQTSLELTDRFDMVRLESLPQSNPDEGFTLGLWRNGGFLLPVVPHFKDSQSQNWRKNRYGGYIMNEMNKERWVCSSFHCQTPLEEIEAAKFVPQSR